MSNQVLWEHKQFECHHPCSCLSALKLIIKPFISIFSTWESNCELTALPESPTASTNYLGNVLCLFWCGLMMPSFTWKKCLAALLTNYSLPTNTAKLIRMHVFRHRLYFSFVTEVWRWKVSSALCLLCCRERSITLSVACIQAFQATNAHSKPKERNPSSDSRTSPKFV